MPAKPKDRIKRLFVDTEQGRGGELVRESQFIFNCASESLAMAVSLSMPPRAQSYTDSTLFPIFAMSRPEGWLAAQIAHRLAKHVHLDDMRLLALVGHNLIGRVSLVQPDATLASPNAQFGLNQILKAQPTSALFDAMAEAYFASGVSGVQPKVLVPDVDAQTVARGRATALQPDLIVKSRGVEYPHLAVNEFICMDAARRAGLDVPDFWLSDDGGLFVVRRFDLADNGRIGFEDMAVLSGRRHDHQGNYKYEGSYEGVARIVGALCPPERQFEQLQRLFEAVALSVLVRNGDAHLKNFGMVYDDPSKLDSIRMAPIYDVVTTTVYPVYNSRTGVEYTDQTMALKMRKDKRYPSPRELHDFAQEHCLVREPARIIERISQGMSESLAENGSRLPQDLREKLQAQWDLGRLDMQYKPPVTRAPRQAQG